MLNLARQTLKRVPSFQELLQGKMGSAKEEMYLTAPHMAMVAATNSDQVPSTCSLSALDRRVSEQQSASTRLYARASAFWRGKC